MTSVAVKQRGARVFLRRPEPGDEQEFLAAARRSRRDHDPWVSAPTRAPLYAAYLSRCDEDDFEGLLVCEAETGCLAGVVNFSQIFRGNFRSAYTGYYAFAGQEGRGLMTEGLGLAIRHAFVALRLHRVEANIQPDNARSIALARRCGFRLEGYSPRYLKIAGKWRDHERWALTLEDWRAAR